MNIPLDCFEQYIDETILKRGLAYFKGGHVEEVAEVSPDNYEAIVRGTEDYQVEMRTERGVVKEASCDCPHDADICKHIVAVIFYLQQEVLDIAPSQKKDKKKQGDTKRVKTPKKDEVENILSQVSNEELEKFIRVKSKENRQFKLDFLSCFASLTTNAKEVYRKQIGAVVQGVKRKEYVEYQDAQRIRKTVKSLLNQAESAIGEGQCEKGMIICQTVLEEMAELIKEVNYPEVIADNVSAAIDMLKQFADRRLPDSLKSTLFNYCTDISSKELLRGWDWDVELIDLASKLISSSEDEQKLFQIIDGRYSPDADENEDLQSIKLTIIRQTQGEEAVQDYMRANVAMPFFRYKLVKDAIEKKNYAEAETLAERAVEQGKNKSPNELQAWYDALFQIAGLQKDVVKITEYARWLLLHNGQNPETYYEALKQNVAASEWKSFIDRVIAEASAGRFRMDSLTPLTGFIYVKENRIDELYAQIKSSEYEFLLQHYDRYLVSKYAKEVADMYREMFANMLSGYMVNRSDYKRVTNILMHMNDIGLKKYTNTIIEEFRTKYPKRPAFMEELDKITN